jgi:hypothetical protein
MRDNHNKLAYKRLYLYAIIICLACIQERVVHIKQRLFLYIGEFMYIRNLVLLSIIIIIPINFYGTSTQQESPTDCLGTIILYNGEKIDVSDIQIGFHSTFEVYSVPPIDQNIPTTTTKGRTELSLTRDPRGAATSYNIVNIKTIKVPSPDTVYIYKETDKSIGRKYVEILVNEERFLAPKETKIEAVQKDKKNRRIIKLHALKEFAIKECIVIVPEDKKTQSQTSS